MREFDVRINRRLSLLASSWTFQTRSTATENSYRGDVRCIADTCKAEAAAAITCTFSIHICSSIDLGFFFYTANVAWTSIPNIRIAGPCTARGMSLIPRTNYLLNRLLMQAYNGLACKTGFIPLHPLSLLLRPLSPPIMLLSASLMRCPSRC